MIKKKGINFGLSSNQLRIDLKALSIISQHYRPRIVFQQNICCVLTYNQLCEFCSSGGRLGILFVVQRGCKSEKL